MKKKFLLLLVLVCCFASTCYCGTLGDIFINAGRADKDHVLELAGFAGKSIITGPKKISIPSSVPVYESYSGIFVPNSNKTSLAIFSDDGCKVYINNRCVLDKLNNIQELSELDNSFNEIDFNFSFGKRYKITVEYSNVLNKGETDIDGLTLYAFNGGGYIPADLSSLGGVYNQDGDGDDNSGDDSLGSGLGVDDNLNILGANKVTDTTPPNPGICAAPATATDPIISVTYSGASDDESGLSYVYLWYKFGSTGTWKQTIYNSTTASGTFKMFLVDGTGVYYFDLRAKDKAGNYSAIPTGSGDTSCSYTESVSYCNFVWVLLPE